MPRDRILVTCLGASEPTATVEVHEVIDGDVDARRPRLHTLVQGRYCEITLDGDNYYLVIKRPRA